MKTPRSLPVTLTLAWFLGVCGPVPAQTSAFTFQGRLGANGAAANGVYDFMFRLLNDPTNGTAAPVIPINFAVGIGTTNPASALHVVGTVTATAFNPPSDRNLKENFAPVSAREVLDKVTALPISRWNFKGDTATLHVGPMAQDFHAAFGLGTDDKHIATVDADGVAPAAIQGLNQKLTEELKRCDAENVGLKARLKRLEILFAQLQTRSPNHHE